MKEFNFIVFLCINNYKLPEIFQEIITSYPNIKHHFIPKPLGTTAKAKATTAKLFRKKFGIPDVLIFVDDDSYIHKNCLNILARYIIKHPDTGKVSALGAFKKWVYEKIEQGAKRLDMPFAGVCYAVNAKYYYSVGGIHPDADNWDDTDISWRLYLSGLNGYVLVDADVTHARNMKNPKIIRHGEPRKIFFKKHFKQYLTFAENKRTQGGSIRRNKHGIALHEQRKKEKFYKQFNGKKNYFFVPKLREE